MSTPLTVAHLAPYSMAFPLRNHNGRYDWMLDLAKRQAQSGLKVIIYSNPGSSLPIPGITWRSVEGTFLNRKDANHALLSAAFRASDIDLYHSHFDNLHYEHATETGVPIVVTQHWWPTKETIRLAAAYPASNVWMVPPTKYMKDFDGRMGLQTKGHIYHGIDLSTFHPLAINKIGRLLCVGRISPEKNVDLSLMVAKKAGIGLDIIGKVAEKNQDYWKNLQPMIDGEQIRYLGQKTHDQLPRYYSSARAVLFPSDVNEPFGLVAIEAQACGTPVIMKRGGSRGELVADGASGFLCNSEDDFVEAIRKSADIQQKDCVEFAKKFDVTAMVNSYFSLYNDLINHPS